MATRRRTMTSPRRWPSAASSPSRRIISTAAKTATGGSIARRTRSRRRSSRSSSRSTTHPALARTLPFVDASGSRSMASAMAARRPCGSRRSWRGIAFRSARATSTMDAQGGGDRPAVQLHAHHRVGDAVLEFGPHVQLRRDGLPDGAPPVHGRARPPRPGRPRPVGRPEYAKVRWLYAQLGLADRTAIEFFQGGHSINGEGTRSTSCTST